ncbi:epidermal growth factor receptor substrate 15-like [Clytia hemisphaerica]|uniref:Cnidarian restricted protein n=1 Tax=Clytia hemisphaerica TaxID=252671 RepID=A0A7M5XD20_9CNID
MRFIHGFCWLFFITNANIFGIIQGCIEEDVKLLQNQMKNKTQKIISIENQLVSTSVAISQIEKENSGLISKLTNDQYIQDQQIKRIKKQTADNSNEITKIKAELSTKTQQIAQIKSDIASEGQERAKIQAKQTKDGQTIAQIKSQMSKNQQEIATMKGEMQKNKQDIAHLKGQVTKNGQGITALKSRLTSVETMATKANDFLQYILQQSNGVYYIHTPPYTNYIKSCRWVVGAYARFKHIGHGQYQDCLVLCIKASTTDSSITGAMFNLDRQCSCLQKGGGYVGYRKYQSCHFK